MMHTCKWHQFLSFKHLGTNVYSNRPFCDLVPFLPYRSRMKSFIILLVVAIFLTASDGYPVKLQINPCLCSCYGLLRSCQNRCNDMTDSGQRSRCNSSTLPATEAVSFCLAKSRMIKRSKKTADFTES